MTRQELLEAVRSGRRRGGWDATRIATAVAGWTDARIVRGLDGLRWTYRQIVSVLDEACWSLTRILRATLDAGWPVPRTLRAVSAVEGSFTNLVFALGEIGWTPGQVATGLEDAGLSDQSIIGRVRNAWTDGQTVRRLRAAGWIDERIRLALRSVGCRGCMIENAFREAENPD